jgi:hypothetical protein
MVAEFMSTSLKDGLSRVIFRGLTRLMTVFPAAAVLCAAPAVRAALPMVAIHDSEYTRGLEQEPVVAPFNTTTPTGAGTTGYEWWPTQWHYFVMPDAVKQALHADGTPYAVVGDSNITSGALLDVHGNPNYPIVISLASEAVTPAEAAQLTNYVAAGGFLFVGSSAFTRDTNGASLGDFAMANQMGVHLLQSNNLQNWTNNFTFTKTTNNQIVSHIPGMTLTWQMPSSADEVSWPYQGVFAPERIWTVQAGDASVIAMSDNTPYLLVKAYGKGYFIYDAAMQPLIGHGGYAPGMYAYGIVRKAIEWAFQSQRTPIAKLSPWPYQYDAAFMMRHDLENFGNLITNIAACAAIENGYGAKGDYFFCTGTLRQELSNSPAGVAQLSAAITNYNATIGPHNGGLQNPQNASLNVTNYDYWHWGPDQALDVPGASLPLPGYPDGRTYALVSLSNSFADVDGWLGSLSNSTRLWVAPYFNATREASIQIEQQLNVKITGDGKLSPFPTWTLSTQVPDLIYPMLQIPVSDWYINNIVAQALETGHTGGTIHDAVDYYYGLGALINIYTHSEATLAGNSPVDDYIKYSLNASLHPNVWSANSLGIYQWWLRRDNAQVTTTYSTNGTQSTVTLAISGATDTNTAVEVLLPGGCVWSALTVLTNNVAANNTCYRTNSNSALKIRVGTSVTNVQVKYVLRPTANNQNYITTQNQPLSVPAQGLLKGATTGTGASLTASALINPSHGTLVLTNNGGFTYTPSNNFTGVDSFVYASSDGVTNSTPATVTVDVAPTGALFFDNFSRATNALPLAPWTVGVGKWTITNGTMLGTVSGEDDFSDAYGGDPTWTDLTLQTDVQIPANAGAWDSGVGIRVNPLTGERYLINIYPEGSNPAGQAGGPIMRIIKAHGWRAFTSFSQYPLPPIGGAVHNLKVTARGNHIVAWLDGNQVAELFDNGIDGIPAYTNGAVSAHMFATTEFSATFDNLIVTPLPTNPTAAADSYTMIQGRTLSVTNPGVLINDQVGLGTNLTAVLVTSTTNGALTLTNGGGFTYVPSNNFFGTDTFTYYNNDGLSNSTPALVTITVLSNRPPIALSNSYSMTAGHLLTVAAPGVLGNDSAGWGTNLTANLIASTTHGVLNLTNDGSFSYLPTNNFVGTDSFTYQAFDGVTNSSTATVTITVLTNYPPVATNDAYSALENQNLSVSSGGVLANDFDQNGDPLTAQLIGGPSHGVLTLTNNGNFSYTPAPNFVGVDAFTYQAFDGVITSATATVTITVVTNAGVYQPPTANNDAYEILSGVTLTVPTPGVLGNDVAHNGNTLTATLVNPPLHGTFTLTNNGGFSYTATNNYVGLDSFTYTAGDGFSNSTPATVTIQVDQNQAQNSLFFDDFNRAGNANILTPWITALGIWNVTNSTLHGTASNEDDYANAYIATNWTDYAVEARLQIPDGAAAEGICGRVNPAYGANYAAVISPGGSTLQIAKYYNWGHWDTGNPMVTASLPTVGTNWHTLRMAFRGNLIGVYWDGVQVTNVADNNSNGTNVYFSGGIGTHMFMTGGFISTYDYFRVDPLVMDDAYNVNVNSNLVVAAPGVLTNDTAVVGSLVATLISSPTNGTIVFNSDGSFTYTPTNGIGTDSFVYRANDAVTNLGTARVTLAIAAKPTLTVTPDNFSRAYGQTNPIFTGTLNGLRGGDNITANYSTTATTNSAVGPYLITATLNDPNNLLGSYIVITNSGTLTVTRALLTVSADNQARMYGSTNPTLTASYIGFVNGETTNVLNGAPTLNTTATSGSAPGTYTISVTQGTLSAANYSFSFTNGTLTVTPAALIVTANNTNRTYGATNPIFTVTYSGFVNGDTTNVLTGAPTVGTTADTNSPVGPYTITPALGTLGTTANYYTFALSNGVLNVNPAVLIVSADNQTKTYGVTNPVLTASYSGFVNNDNAGVLTGAPIVSTGATTNSAVGSYPINVTQGTLAAANYTFSFSAGTLSVTKATLLASADNKSRLYGVTNPVFTASYSGFVNNDAPTVVGGNPAFNTSADTNSPVGQYAINISQGTLNAFNYAFSFTNGTLTIGQAMLNVNVNNTNRPYGATNPIFTVSYVGFLNGDTTNVLTGAPVVSSGAATNSPVGSYPINILPGNLASTNYAFTFNGGTLTVAKATLTVSGDNKNRAYGATNPVFTVTYSGLQNNDALTVLSGSPTVTTSATTNSPVGQYAISVSQGTLNAFNYAFSCTNGTLTINPVTLGVTVNNTNRTYGAANPAFTVSYSGFLNNDTASVVSGTPSFNPSATQASPVGSYGVSASTGTLSATNYVFSFTNGTLTVNPAVLTVTADNKTNTVGSPIPTLTASYSGFMNGETLGTSGVTGQPNLSTTATQSSPLGNYTISITQGTLAANNYTFNMVAGNLFVVNIVPPVITSITISNATNVVVQWTAVSNSVYRLQYQTNLLVTNWTSIVPDITATNTTAVGKDVPGSDPQRFYRVMVVQ